MANVTAEQLNQRDLLHVHAARAQCMNRWLLTLCAPLITFTEACKRLGVPKPVCIQNDFSLVDRRFTTELAETCAPWNHNISGCPYGILSGGTLTGPGMHQTGQA